MSEPVIPQGFKGPAESILGLRKEINCFAGYKVQNVLRDETKIFCVFLTVKECRVLAWGWGLREGALRCNQLWLRAGVTDPPPCAPLKLSKSLR